MILDLDEPTLPVVTGGCECVNGRANKPHEGGLHVSRAKMYSQGCVTRSLRVNPFLSRLCVSHSMSGSTAMLFSSTTGRALTGTAAGPSPTQTEALPCTTCQQHRFESSVLWRIIAGVGVNCFPPLAFMVKEIGLYLDVANTSRYKTPQTECML